MTRKNTTFKRNRTPFTARQRAVSLRHFPYKTAKKYTMISTKEPVKKKKPLFIDVDDIYDIKENVEIPDLKKAEGAEPVEKKIVMIKDDEIIPVETEVKEEIIEEVVPEEKPRKKRKTRKEKEREIAENIASQDVIGIFAMLLHPARSIRTAAHSDNCSFSPMIALILSFVKWLMFGFMMSVNHMHEINQVGYSVNRMNFSEAAILALEVGVVGLCASMICIVVAKITAVILRSDVWGRKIAWTLYRPNWIVTVLACIVTVSLTSLGTDLGMKLCMLVLLVSGAFKVFCMYELFRENKIHAVIMTVVYLAFEFGAFYAAVQYVFPSLSVILKMVGIVA